MADLLNGVFFSEILADNAGGQAIDTDGDGNTNKADEFIEFGNVSGETISLAGYQVWSEKNGLLYTFGATATLNDGETATVVGNYEGGDSGGFYDAGIAENGNFIPDGEGQKFDTIFLYDPNTNTYISFSYGQPPRTPTLPDGFPTSATQVGGGESINSSAPNGTAFARDANGNFVETTPTPGTPDIACFAEDTLILSRHGEKPVCELRPGDMVPTYDHGTQPIIGICALYIPVKDLLRVPAHRPLTVDGALFDAVQSVRLSPAHCLLYASPFAEALFASSQVLLPARHLQTAGLARGEMPRQGVTYYHLLFANHAMVLANGLWSESYLNVADAPRDAHADGWQFVQGASLNTSRHSHAARPILRRYETQLLLKTHQQRAIKPYGIDKATPLIAQQTA
ncbi:Hint domain-containing protein [uncultured Tateyamaria sp.]|uniref:Hint domain-containing protein n=1 Tax=uncultured Tateyamaria sp. TaxID=455651 RepID=UPI002620DBA6|nr:Hint domain-containing protein [uncultured Tateyamaria sp.]